MINSLTTAIIQRDLLSFDIMLKPCLQSFTNSIKGYNKKLQKVCIVEKSKIYDKKNFNFHNTKLSQERSNFLAYKKGENGNNYLFRFFLKSIGETPELDLKNLVKQELSSKLSSKAICEMVD